MLKRLNKWRTSERRPVSLTLPISLSKKKTQSYIAEFKSGDEGAFSKIYSRFQKPILRYVKSKVSDPELAEEITQEIFIKMYRFRDSYQEQFAFSTWLWTIAKNTISDHLRGLKNTQNLSVNNGDDPIVPDELPCTKENAETLIIRKDQKKQLLKILKSLTRLQKRVLWLRMIHHLSYQEISKHLGISLSAVKNLAYRAKITLTENAILVPSMI
jgi:RNA polymerase sigma-70 factor (ECF subfamily)